LIQSAFERHQAVQINYDRGLWNVEKHDREQPKEKMRRTKFGGRADPGRAHYKNDLR
jgi:hypothetical protein